MSRASGRRGYTQKEEDEAQTKLEERTGRGVDGSRSSIVLLTESRCRV